MTNMFKKYAIGILLLLLTSPVFSDELIVDFEEESVPILNEELRKIEKDIDAAAAAGLWETEGGDTELKTADDIDVQNMQLKGMCIENRTDDTGCTQTGRIWFRTDL